MPDSVTAGKLERMARPSPGGDAFGSGGGRVSLAIDRSPRQVAQSQRLAQLRSQPRPGSAAPLDAAEAQRRHAVVQRLGNPANHARVGAGNFNDPNNLLQPGNHPPPHLNHQTSPTTIYDLGVARPVINEGASMTAYPISTRTRAGGSGTNAAVRAVSQAATAFYGRKYIAGHLLNSHLGGDGTNQSNITAFTAKSNSQHHAGIEKELKDDVSSGYIAHYAVDCMNRRNIAPPGAVNEISGLASTMNASYSLLRVNGDPDVPADYQPVRLLNLNLDPAGAGQAALKDGQAMAEGDSFLDYFSGKFLHPDSDDEFADIVDAASGMDTVGAAQYILLNLNQIGDAGDRALVQNELQNYLRGLAL